MAEPITRRSYLWLYLVVDQGAPPWLASEAIATTALEHPEWDMNELVDPVSGKKVTDD